MEHDRTVRAFVPEPGRRERLAAELAAARPGGALYGIPVGVKDIIRVDGLPTRAGSALPPGALAGPQATVVDRLRAAGALVAGKTVTAEFAMTAPGPTRNPHNHAHTPGGSSSGSAAAVAAGLVPLAIGTQTVGSLIRPAAYCGIVGFRPTYGRIPSDGVIPNVPSIDTVGVLAPDVAGVARCAAVLCDDWQPVTAPGRPPVLGIPVGPYLARAGAEALEAFNGRVRALGSAGFEVREVPVMADFDAVVRQMSILNRYEAARSHAGWFPRYGHLYREQSAATVRQGQAFGPADHVRALGAREALRDRLLDAMASGPGPGIDLWLAPSATGPAPLGLHSTGDGIMCLPWSYAGLPAVSLPAGRAANGLPLGLQCVARPGGDEQLLAWSAVLGNAAQR